MFSSFPRSNAGQRLTATALMMAGLTQAAHAQGNGLKGSFHSNGLVLSIVPEPSSWVAFVIGGVSLLFLAYKARQRQVKA